MNVIQKRSVILHGHKTSISLESCFWKILCEIADQQQMAVSRLAQQIDKERNGGNLSSAIRVFVLNHVCARLVGELSPDVPANRTAPQSLAGPML